MNSIIPKLTILSMLLLLSSPLTAASQKNSSEDGYLSTLISSKIATAEAADSDEAWNALYDLSVKLYLRARQKSLPSPTSRQELCRRLVKLYGKTPNKKKSKRLKEKIVELMTAYGKGDKAVEELVLNLLDQGPKNLRNSALTVLGNNEVSISGNKPYNKILELEQRNQLNEAETAAYLRKADSKRAFNEIVKRIKATNDKRSFVKMAIVLTTYDDPAAFREALSRVKELRLQEPYDDHEDGLFWLNTPLFSKFVTTANDDDLRLGMGVVELGAPVDLSAAIIKRKLIAHNDPFIRRAAIKHLRKVSGDFTVPMAEVKQMFKKRLPLETDDGVLKVLQEELEAIQTLQRHRRIRSEIQGSK